MPEVNRSATRCGSSLSSQAWNSGLGLLERVASEKDAANQNIYERIHLDDGSYYDRLAGIFVWHEEHGHFHFEEYALYTLQAANAPGASERTSSKTTFCVIDTDRINHRLPGAPKRPVYRTCGGEIQGMSVGWGDTYRYCWLLNEPDELDPAVLIIDSEGCIRGRVDDGLDEQPLKLAAVPSALMEVSDEERGET